jgi:hypothetical protein
MPISYTRPTYNIYGHESIIHTVDTCWDILFQMLRVRADKRKTSFKKPFLYICKKSRVFNILNIAWVMELMLYCRRNFSASEYLKEYLSSVRICPQHCMVTLQNVYSPFVYSRNIYSQNVYSQNVYSPSVCILTLNVYHTKTYTNIPGFSLSASSYFSSLPQASDTKSY